MKNADMLNSGGAACTADGIRVNATTAMMLPAASCSAALITWRGASNFSARRAPRKVRNAVIEAVPMTSKNSFIVRDSAKGEHFHDSPFAGLRFKASLLLPLASRRQ